MKRSISVTLSAIMVLIGSTLTIGTGLLAATSLLLERGRTSPHPEPAAVALFGTLMMVLPGIWGIATGLGLLFLKRWARISILIFAALLATMGLFTAPIILLIPFPATPGLDESLLSGIRIGIAAFYIVLAAIGIWWLVLFSRQSVKQQFFGGHPIENEDGRPLSISIIARLLILGAMFMPFGLLTRVPTVFLGFLLTGWTAALVYAGYGVVCLYLGIGLLRLKPISRTLGIYYSIFAIVNMAFFYLRPGYDARMSALMNRSNNIFHSTQPPMAFPVLPMFVMTAALMGVQIYFLVTRKRAFAPPQPGAPAALVP